MKKLKKKWVIVQEDRSGTIIPAWWNTDKNNISTPVTYNSEREAYIDIADTYEHRIKTFLKDKTLNCFDIDEDIVVACTITPDGIVNTEFGEVFSPFKPQETYGR